MFALSGLVLAAMLLPMPAAQTGSWTYAVTGDTTGTTFTDNGSSGYIPPFSPVSSGVGSSAGCPAFAITRGGNGPSGNGCNINLVLHVQVTFTWQPAAGQTMTTDPPPPNVLVQESATSFWSASSGNAQRGGSVHGLVANSLSDAMYNPPSFQSAYSGLGYSGPPPNQSYPAPVPAVASHFQNYPSSSGTVTVAKRTLTATATTTSPNWYYGAQASAGSYGASIHAQPYNFHRVVGKGSINTDGSITFVYDWNSTTGSKDDLTSCFWHEYVTYPGNVGTAANPNPYYPPDPPFDFPTGVTWLNNPEIGPGIGNQGGPMTGTNTVTDNQLVPPLVVPPLYTYGTYTGTQVFQYMTRRQEFLTPKSLALTAVLSR